MSILTPYLNRQLFTSILILLGGVSFAVTPYITSVYLFYGLSLLTGIGLGNMSTISNTWLIEMWTGRLLAVLLQAVQLFHGFGYIVGPLLIKSHLHGHLNASKVNQMTVPEYKAEIGARRHGLIAPYIIVGSIVCLVGFLYLALYLSVIFRYRKSSSRVKSSETVLKVKLFESLQNRHQLRLFLVLILAIFATNNVVEVGFNSFQETLYQSLPSVKVTASEAAGVVSLGSSGYTAGRIVSILLSTVLSPGNLLLFHFALSASGFLGLLWSTHEKA